MVTERIWVLGAPDPEMNLIENLLRECGEHIEYATVQRDGVSRRVTPGEAYGDDVEIGDGLRGLSATAYMVECAPCVLDGPSVDWAGVAYSIDHHRPGDPGYGRPPTKFMSASSIGQVIRELARIGVIPSTWRRMAAGCAAPLTPQYDVGGSPVDYTGLPWLRAGHGGEDAWDIVLDANTFARVPRDLVLCAAADHCLAAAYRGECPGVDPDALMWWRVETRAAHQGRSADDVLADVELARKALRDAPAVDLARMSVRDMRDAYTITTFLVWPFVEGATCDAAGVGDDRWVVFGRRDEGVWDEGGHHTSVRRGVPELPEAATREGVAYLATVTDRDGRQKIVLGGHTTPEVVRAFMEQWAPAHCLTGVYGDPARGFAGGYMPE